MKTKHKILIGLNIMFTLAWGQASEKHIIDYGNHLTSSQISELNKQIDHLNYTLNSTFKVIFFNSKQIFGHELNKELTIEEYLSSISYKEKILLVFANNSSSETNFWAKNLHIKIDSDKLSEKDIEIIKMSSMKDLAGVPFASDDIKDEHRTIYFNTILKIISNISSSAKSVIEIHKIDKEFGAGVEGYKKALAEELEINYSISEENASFGRIQVYTSVNELVFQSNIELGQKKVFNWNGKMNQGTNNEKYITRALCQYNNNNQPSFKVVLQASKNKTFDFYSQQEAFAYINEFTSEFLEAGSFKNWVYHTKDMPQKNKFRRYIYLREKYTHTLEKAKLNEIPIAYLKENITSYKFKHASGDKNLSMHLHKEFQLLIDDIIFKADYSKGFGGSFNMRINVNNTERISPHGWGIAFDLDVPHNQNLNSSKNFHVFNQILTDKYLYNKNVSDILTETSNEFNSIMASYFGTDGDNFDGNYSVGISAIGESYIALSTGDSKSNTFMNTMLNFLDPNISIQWENQFKEVKKEVFTALDINDPSHYLLKVNSGGKYYTYDEEAIKACDNFLKETEFTYNLIRSKENIEKIIENINIAFLLKQRKFDVKDLNSNQELEAQFATLEYLVQSIKTYKQLVSQKIPQNPPPKPNYYYFKENYTYGFQIGAQKYTSIYNEIVSCHKCLNSYLKAGISYKSIGDKMTKYYAVQANWIAAFKNGFSSIDLTDSELWIGKKYLKWGGEFSRTKDAMHFELDEGRCLIPFLSVGHKLKDLPQFK